MIQDDVAARFSPEQPFLVSEAKLLFDSGTGVARRARQCRKRLPVFGRTVMVPSEVLIRVHVDYEKQTR